MDFFSSFSTDGLDSLDSLGGLDSSLDRATGRRRAETPEEERGFFDRVFAPFEAPQQTLFSLIKTGNEDGLSLGDIGKSFKHGFLYSNPWSNQQRITPDEVGDIMFGDTKNKWASMGRNTFISLAFDPLAFVPLAKATRLIGPGTKVGDAMTTFRAARGMEAGNLVAKQGKKLLGESRYEEWSSAIGQNLISKWWGTPDELRERVDAFDRGVQHWRIRTAEAIKDSEKLGGKQGQLLMAEALESDNFFHASVSGSRAAESSRTFESVLNRAKDMGIHEDDFLRIYTKFRGIDDEIGDGLFKLKVIGGDEFATQQGKHLRRKFEAYDRPREYLERIEATHLPDVERVNMGLLKNNLNTFRDELDNLYTIPKSEPKGTQFLFTPNEDMGIKGHKYFTTEGGRERFNVQRFAEDVDAYLDFAPESSVDEVLDHVKNNMLTGTIPPNVSKAILNHITESTVNLNTIKTGISEKLSSMLNNPGVTWYTFGEHVEKVSKRKNLPPEILEVLGEIKEAAPRIADEGLQAGKVLELRKFIAGVGGAKVDEAGEYLADDAGNLILEGTELLSKTREGIKGAAVQITTDRLGPGVKDMWAKPSVARVLQRLDSSPAPTGGTEKIAAATGRAIAGLTSFFKVNKVILDPAAHARNFLGNLVLADVSGINPFIGKGNLARSVQEVYSLARTGKGGKYIQLANDAGVHLFQHTFSQQELSGMATKISQAGNITNDAEAIGGLRKIYEGVTGAYGGTVDKAGRLYEMEEQIFKLTAFVQRYEETISNLASRGKAITPDLQHNVARAAGEYADKALFDYGDVPYLVDFARKYGVVPFITFPWKATGRTAEVLFSDPHRILKYPRVVDQINEDFAPSKEQVRSEIAALPEWARKEMVVKLPWKDGFDREQFIDMSFFMPWYTIKEMADSIKNAEGPMPKEGLFAPPALMLLNGFTRNEDGLGRPIATDDMSAAEKAGAYGSWLFEQIAPPSMPGGTRAKSIGRALLSVAQDNPTPLNMAAGTYGRILMAGDPATKGEGLDKMRRPPSNQAQVSSPGENGPEFNLFGAFLQSNVGLSTIGSDPVKAATSIQGKARASITDLQKQRASVIGSNLSKEEKFKRIMRLQEQINEAQAESTKDLRNIFGR